MSQINRNDSFSAEVDRIDCEIANLIIHRNVLMKSMPEDYDSDGEGEIYFRKLKDQDQAENVYHAIARI